MKILGIDPGYAIVGYGVLETGNNRTVIASEHGCIRTSPKNGDAAKRLHRVYLGVCELLESYKPSCISVEKLFFARNTTTALQVSEARGVILLAAEQRGVPVFEYTPNQIKLAVTGSGRADKKQIQAMVTRLLGLSKVPTPDDAADGLAIALCHLHFSESNIRRE